MITLISRFAHPSILFIFLCLSTAGWAANPAGHVTKLDGKAYAKPLEGDIRQLSVNDKVFAEERLITSRDSSLEFTFTDKTRLTLGASTIINLDSYQYKSEAEEESEGSTTSILQGVVRAFTGLIAKRKPTRVRFRTSVATIGIRGTHFVAEVEGDSATIILLAQEDPDASNAIEVSNSFGRVEIDKAGYGTNVPNAQSPPSRPRRMQTPNSMTQVLRSLRTNQRVRIPRSPIR
ncbi:MAG: FecR domain-containing protein [Pseudomonadota bacterium]